MLGEWEKIISHGSRTQNVSRILASTAHGDEVATGGPDIKAR
jgi:hypothetical protein